jgi:hypothetical protein
MTLVKSLHSGNPNVIQTRGFTPDDLTNELSLLAECMSVSMPYVHWGSHVLVQVPNCNKKKCSPPTAFDSWLGMPVLVL